MLVESRQQEPAGARKDEQHQRHHGDRPGEPAEVALGEVTLALAQPVELGSEQLGRQDGSLP